MPSGAKNGFSSSQNWEQIKFPEYLEKIIEKPNQTTTRNCFSVLLGVALLNSDVYVVHLGTSWVIIVSISTNYNWKRDAAIFPANISLKYWLIVRYPSAQWPLTFAAVVWVVASIQLRNKSSLNHLWKDPSQHDKCHQKTSSQQIGWLNLSLPPYDTKRYCPTIDLLGWPPASSLLV